MAARKDPDRIELEGVTATIMRARGERNGRRYWRARTTGKERRTIWAGWGTRAEVSAVVAALVANGLPSPRSSPGPARTVADFLARWVEHQERRREGGQIAPRSLTNYRQAARYWTAAIGDVSARALTRELVEDTVVGWLAKGIAPRTCKLAVDVLCAAVKWGSKRDHCPAVELGRLSVLKIRDDEFVANAATPTRDQVDAVLEHLDGWYRDVLHLQSLTGARIAEVVALRVGDWDRAGHELVLSGRDERRSRRGKVKPRAFPVMGDIAVLLERLAGDRSADEPMVVGPPTEFSGQLGERLREACIAAEVPVFTTHGIRRMVVMELLDAPGAEAKSVSDLTGHSVQILLRRYVRPTRQRLRDLVARSGLASPSRRGKVHHLRAQVSGTRPEDADGDE
jgi:integrase